MENSSTTQKKSKTPVQIILAVTLIFTCLFSTGVRILAPGWFLVFFGIVLVLLPLLIHLIVHVLVITRADRAKPALYPAIFLSHLSLFLCFLTQPDFGDIGGVYSGLSTIFSWIGIEIPGMEGNGVYILPIVFAVFLFLTWIVVHLPWFYHRRESPQAVETQTVQP